MTCDTWHATSDMWHMEGDWTFSQNLRFLAHTVWEWRCLEDISTKDEWLNELMNYKGVCRTLGLLISTGIVAYFTAKDFCVVQLFIFHLPPYWQVLKNLQSIMGKENLADKIQWNVLFLIKTTYPFFLNTSPLDRYFALFYGIQTILPGFTKTSHICCIYFPIITQ